MQHYLSASPAVRHDWSSLARLWSDSPTCSRRLLQNAAAAFPCRPLLQNVAAFPHYRLRSADVSSSLLQRSCGLLPFRSIRKFQSRPGNFASAIAFNKCDCDDASGQKLPAEKVIRLALSIAVAIAVAVFAKVGSAQANSQLMLSNLGQSPAVAKGGRELFVSAWMGLMAGCLHTLTGPDHLAALAPLSIGCTRLQSVAVGALWGCGHDAGQVIFGILFLLLKDKLHIEVLRTWGARVVGMTLVAIGIVGMKEAHEASLVPCLAGGSSGLSPNIMSHMEPMNGGKKNLSLATFATGIVHGLQPDALIMILPALALPSRLSGAAFLIMFLLGTVFSMSGYTVFIGSCSNALQKHIPRITEHLSWGSSLVAILVGAGILGSELFGLTIF